MSTFDKRLIGQMETLARVSLCEAAFNAGNAEGIKEGMRRAAEIAGAKEDQFIALAGEAADNTMRKHYSALASGAGTAAAAILKEAGE